MPLVVPAKVRAPVPDALPRERLEARLAEAFGKRLTLVVAPAGSGKTTLVARFAATCGAPVAWYRAETWDADEDSFVRHLEAALRSTLPGIPGGWSSIDDVARALESHPGEAALLVIDDGHALEGTPAEVALGRLVDYAPAWLAVIVASRVPPSINLPRLRVSGDLLELGQDDLRFRSWEVEQLFRNVYHDPVPPADLAALARRMEGWAAGLQLFHLATRGRSVEERRRVLTAGDVRGRMLREYLAQNVLAELPDPLREFLLETCVLGRLSGSLCDRLRGTTGSSLLLDELARRSVFTMPVEDEDEDDVYRYHEVLRSNLDRILVVQVGEVEARRRYARAAALLEADGALAEALIAWCRAEDWVAVDRLLAGGGERLANGGTAWLEALPPALVRHDPWLALATARRARAEGRWAAAIESYSNAAAGLGGTESSAACRRERAILSAWIDPAAILPAHWTGPLRTGLARDPRAAAREATGLDDAVGLLVRGLLLLASGSVREASRALRQVAHEGRLEPSLAAAARLGAAIADLLRADPEVSESLAAAIEDAERAGVPWLMDLGRGVAQQLTDPGVPTDDQEGSEPGPVGVCDGDPWTVGLGALVRAWVRTAGRPGAGIEDPVRPLTDAATAATQFRSVGAGALEAWARALGALVQAESGLEGSRDAALAAEAFGRLTGVAGARHLAYRALELADPDRAAEYAILADGMGEETGLALPAARAAIVASPASPAGTSNGRWTGLEVGVLGGFRASVDGQPLDLTGVKPRARALLRLLALHAPDPVHREVLQEALWPEADGPTGARSLQVAISALRGQLAAVAPLDATSVIERQGEVYRLVVPSGAVDVRRFEQALAEARSLEERRAPAIEAFRAALALYPGDVLPEDGPAEWVVGRREQVRFGAIEASVALAAGLLAVGDLAGAVHACHAGLALDRFHDPLWRLLIVARERAGDTGAASRDRREYAAVLAGLGVSVPPAPPVAT